MSEKNGQTSGAAATDRSEVLRETPSLARDYDRVSADRQFRSGRRLIDEIGVVAGERVLDVGCGTGLLSAHVAGLVGPSGYVLGVDPLPLRIELAQKRSSANLEYRVGDASAVDSLPAGSFDVVYLNAVFHWIADKLSALRAFAKVLRPQGRLGIACMVKVEEPRAGVHAVIREVLSHPPFAAYRTARVDILHPVDENAVPELLDKSGFAILKMNVHDSLQHYATPQEAVDHFLASSAGNFLGFLPQELRQAAHTALSRALESIATPEGIPRQGRRMILVAVRE